MVWNSMEWNGTGGMVFPNMGKISLCIIVYMQSHAEPERQRETLLFPRFFPEKQSASLVPHISSAFPPIFCKTQFNFSSIFFPFSYKSTSFQSIGILNLDNPIS